MAGIDVSGFGLPILPERQSQGLSQLAQNLRYNREWQYRLQKEKEQDDWRKLNLIQDATDLSKYQTSSDLANSIGNSQMQKIFQKYTASVSTMSPAELQANVAKDMSGIVQNMSAIKNELQLGDEQFKQLKAIYPKLDYGKMTQDYRTDVLNRHLKNDTDFNPAIDIKPSTIDWSNPKTLYKYLPNTESLDKAIINPQGLDTQQVLSGNEMSHIEYKGKVPFWMQPNYTAEDLQKGGGYLKKGFIPQLDVKSEDLPSDILPALKNNPRKMVTKDVYEQFYNSHPVEIEKGTADMFGEGAYDKMTDQEKEFAQRDYLYTKLKTLDKNNFYQGTATHTPISLIKLNMQGAGGKEASKGEVNDIFSRIESSAIDKADKYENQQSNTNAYEANEMPYDEQSLIMDFVNKGRNDGEHISPDNIKVIYNKSDGKLGVYKIDTGERLGYLPKTGTNLKVQPGAKEKREVIKQSGIAQETKIDYKNVRTAKDPSGNTIQIGIKNGKWYNIKTGKELQ